MLISLKNFMCTNSAFSWFGLTKPIVFFEENAPPISENMPCARIQREHSAGPPAAHFLEKIKVHEFCIFMVWAY